jgi:hypothetical protein
MGDIGSRRVGVGDENHALIELHCVARARFAVGVAQRAGDDQRVDPARLQDVVQVAYA